MSDSLHSTPAAGRLLALVPAAGVGARAGGAGPGGVPKQYRQLANQPMLRRTVAALLAEPRVTEVHVIVAADDHRAAAALAGLPRTWWHPVGGLQRHKTVANGLAHLRLADDDWVMVHDAARPGLDAEALGRLVDTCLGDAVGGLLALPAADTVKQAADGVPDRIGRTLPRDGIWLAQTPQMFRAGLLRRALAAAGAAGRVPTDEASAVEALGEQPRLVPGSLGNFKVTWPQDFLWMEKWLA